MAPMGRVRLPQALNPKPNPKPNRNPNSNPKPDHRQNAVDALAQKAAEFDKLQQSIRESQQNVDDFLDFETRYKVLFYPHLKPCDSQ